MPIKDHLKLALIAIGVPLTIVTVVYWATPVPNQPKESFPAEEFVPKTIETKEAKARKGADYFEFWLRSPSGKTYFFRDPESGPVERLRGLMPAGQSLRVRSWPSPEGNVLMEMIHADTDEVVLSFEERMETFTHRQRVVSVVAVVWLLAFTGFWIVLSRVKIAPAS